MRQVTLQAFYTQRTDWSCGRVQESSDSLILRASPAVYRHGVVLLHRLPAAVLVPGIILRCREPLAFALLDLC